ncbi:carbohydrate ABC transporter permease [Cellulomonas sp. NPDC089187]|uniref:carbohydrate ABC transporter permease n=1 Tax=Cellulomonas sp. NPDC089187 TaxID=3154970 RepID=UPI00341FFB5B
MSAAVVDTPLPQRKTRRSKGYIGSLFGVNGLLVLTTCYMVFPLLWLVTSSMKSLGALYRADGIPWSDIRLWENIQTVIQANDGIYLRWLGNSILYAGVGAVVGGLIALLAGYAFDKFQFRGKSLWYSTVLAGVLIPATATAIPLYLLASAVNLTNTMWAVMIPFLTNPFGVYLARTFSQGYVPDSVVEAARIDGAGELQIFRRVALPMMAPGYVTIVLFQFVGIWNNFMLPLMMFSNSRLYPVSLGLYNWNAQTTSFPEYYPMVLAGSLLSIIPLLVAFIFLQRFWRAGLTAGSVKA